MSTVRKTLRRQNECKSCGYTWYPRGKDISLKCPKCRSGSVGFSGLGIIGSIVFLIAVSVFNIGGNKSSSSANISKAVSASVSTISTNASVGNQDSNTDKPAVASSVSPTQVSPADRIYTPEEISKMENEKQYHGDDEIVRERLGLPSRETGKMYP